MEKCCVKSVLAVLRKSSNPGHVEDGSLIHIKYEKIPDAVVTARAVEEGERAKKLGLPSNCYTGRFSRLWKNEAGEDMLSMFVELERDKKYRSFNLDRGKVEEVVVVEL